MNKDVRCLLGFHSWSEYDWADDEKGNSGLYTMCSRKGCEEVVEMEVGY